MELHGEFGKREPRIVMGFSFWSAVGLLNPVALGRMGFFALQQTTLAG
jgi:hypothetical protein